MQLGALLSVFDGANEGETVDGDNDGVDVVGEIAVGNVLGVKLDIVVNSCKSWYCK